jgi:hypothetical protein
MAADTAAQWCQQCGDGSSVTVAAWQHCGGGGSTAAAVAKAVLFGGSMAV